MPQRSFLVGSLYESMTVFLTVGSKKNNVDKIVIKNIIAQVNFAGVKTNLVPVYSRCISFFFCDEINEISFELRMETILMLMIVSTRSSNEISLI